MTTTTSQHPNARPSSPRNARNSQSSFCFFERRRPSIVSSRKTTTVKSFQDDDEIESYQTVANPLQYTATEREAMDRKNSLLWQKLTPAWRVLLLSDGSVTRHLSVLGGKGFLSDDDDDDKDATSSLLSESNVKVEVTSMKPCARDKSQPEDVVKIKGPLVQREVYLRYDDDGNDGEPKKNKNPNPPPCTRARGGTRTRWRSL